MAPRPVTASTRPPLVTTELLLLLLLLLPEEEDDEELAIFTTGGQGKVDYDRVYFRPGYNKNGFGDDEGGFECGGLDWVVTLVPAWKT